MIEGIGEKTAEQLLRHFKSIKRIKEADKKSIAEIIGEAKADLVINYFGSK